MESYLLFLVIALVTVLSPGPGVILTLTNTLRGGVIAAIGGILGISIGTFVVAAVSASSIGLILNTSLLAFTLMKYAGGAYLVYLGVKLWKSPSVVIHSVDGRGKRKRVQFLEGLTLQITNPKAIFFFMSVLPQFIDYSSSYGGQFAILVTTYSILVIIIHLLYASLAKVACQWFISQKGGRVLNQFGGAIFICFGIGLASANR
ncbi:LysE family translocator [Motiliproteus sp. MSK22-1]|uniref:LysE family translocator n=1 Tax=Motiliproteus sp. MSK22-1 TaxID=1897630 RepID=UPI000976858E|nr:LysE family translocator [Motiliproteus sp. MSK22-1]OMH33891.1 lysine transporter LysE [Motiliproteus sp. MSK22-1]